MISLKAFGSSIRLRNPVKIILTTAHYPDPHPANCADDNLLYLCQLDHLRLDAPLRAERAKLRRRRGCV